MKPSANQKFGSYVLLSRKGEGSTAEVWECEDPGGHLKAIKIFAPTSTLDSYSKELIKEEFEKARVLNHPHLVVPEQYLDEQGVPALVMKLCERSMWQELMLRSAENQSSNKKINSGLFSEKLIVKLINQISLAIQYLHNNSLVHNDIKPGNIMVNNPGMDDGVVFYLTDFGITKEIRDTIIRQTKTNNSLTFAYAAPEKLRGFGGTTQSDVFSLGASIYELMYGTGLEVPLGHILNNNGVIDFSSAHYSAGLTSLLQGMLEKDPQKRSGLNDIIRTTRDFLIQGTWPDSLSESSSADPRATIRTAPSDLKNSGENIPKKIDLQPGHGHDPRERPKTLEELLGKTSDDAGRNSKTGKRPKILIIGIVTVFILAVMIIAWLVIGPALVLNKYSFKIPLGDKYYLVEKDKKVGISDRRGKLIRPLIYNTGIIQGPTVRLFTDSGTEDFDINN